MEFGIEEFVAHLLKLSVGGTVLTDSMLDYIGATVEKAAKAKFGEYQDEAGPFAGWAQLADSTMADRERQGYPADDPLLRSGETKDSIGHRIGHQEVEIGSDNQILEWLEVGTERMPPRSTLGGAAFKQAPKIVERLGVEMEVFLVGQGVFQGRMKIE
jgi:hypothetical protein